MPDTWSPTTYLQFGGERTRAARDLLTNVPLVSAERIVDVGCGPGNSTALLVARYPDARVIGFDSSEAMLEQARQALPNTPFVHADAIDWRPEPDTDLVFANAIYQWIPDHLALLARTLAALKSGSVLAVQMPDNVREPTHRLMQEVAARGPWAERLASAARAPLPPVGAYYDALRPSASTIDIWHTVYNHVLEGPDAIVDWVRGTGLRPFLDPLAADERREYLRQYTARIGEAYPARSDGRVLLRFPRLFMVAVR
jgi:trans-aconitate 2-methyltransferase